MPHSRRITFGSVIAVLLLFVVGGAVLAEPVATVNGQPVEQQAFYEYMLKRYGSRSLLNLIAAEAIRQAAAKQGLTVTEAEVDAEVAKKRQTFDQQAVETGVDFDMMLLSQGDTLPLFRDSERTLLLLKRLVAKEVSVSDERVQEYYRTNLASFKIREGMKVSFIRMDDGDQMTEVRQSIIAGELTFEAAAKQYSNDPYTKDAGGKVDRWIPRGNSPFVQAAYALLKDGDVSEILPFPSLGYYLIRRDQYVRDLQLDFDEVKGDIHELLVTQVTQALAAAKQRELMKAAKIDFLLQWPEGAFMPPKPEEADTNP
jgi:foldase protein PrsA